MATIMPTYQCLVVQTMEVSGAMKPLFGQINGDDTTPCGDGTRRALFAVCCPLGQLPPRTPSGDQSNGLFGTFRTKHKLDMSIIALGQRYEYNLQ